MALLLLKASAASLNSFALSTSALAEMILASANFFSCATTERAF